jgi:IS1 family transposase
VPDWGDYSEINDPLMKHLYEKNESVLYELYRFEADEMWSFVGNKENKQWIWLVMNTANRQIVAFHVGGRSQEDAKQLFDQIPDIFKTNAVFFTDFWKGYHILDKEKHIAAGKQQGYTNHIERFNNTLRQRCSRLVRKTLAFSKKVENHIGAIKYFICHYNRKLALHI